MRWFCVHVWEERCR